MAADHELQLRAAKARVKTLTEDELITMAQDIIEHGRGIGSFNQALFLELARRLDHYRKAFGIIEECLADPDPEHFLRDLHQNCIDAKNYIELNIS